MKLINAALLLLAILSASPAWAYTGDDLSRWLAANQRIELTPNNANPEDFVLSGMLTGYLTGALDTLDLTETICLPPKVYPRQLIAIVQKELNMHPEKWSGSAGGIVVIAFARTFSCKKK